MEIGRLKRETNPVPGEKPGFLPQHEGKNPDEFVTTGERNPFPVKVKDGNVQVTGTVDVRDKVVKEYFEGTFDLIKTFAEPMSGISVANDGVEHLQFIVNGITRTVYAGEVYNANLDPFTSLKVVAKDKYRIEVLA
jgi:hypothetical protein